MKCPHLYSDLCILVLYTRIMDTTFKHEPLGLSQQFGDHVATICPHGLLQHCRGHKMSARRYNITTHAYYVVSALPDMTSKDMDYVRTGYNIATHAWYAYKSNRMYCTNPFVNLAVTPTSGQPELDTLRI